MIGVGWEIDGKERDRMRWAGLGVTDTNSDEMR